VFLTLSSEAPFFFLSKVIAAGMNPVQIARGIEKTATALVSELSFMSREVRSVNFFFKKLEHLNY